MHAFRKGPEPAELRDERDAFARLGQPLEDRDYFELSAPTKLAVQRALVRDQGSLCAYCGSRIREADMRIEHWVAQSAAGGKAARYDWGNLLGACVPKTVEKHCDEHRGRLPVARQDLSLHPANDHARIPILFRYEVRRDGLWIASGDEGAQRDADETLNLNAELLRRNRLGVQRRLKERIFDAHGKGTVTRATLARLLAPHLDGSLDPYHAVAADLVARYAAKAR